MSGVQDTGSSGRIEVDPAKRFGKAVIRGTRIAVDEEPGGAQFFGEPRRGEALVEREFGVLVQVPPGLALEPGP